MDVCMDACMHGCMHGMCVMYRNVFHETSPCWNSPKGGGLLCALCSKKTVLSTPKDAKP